MASMILNFSSRDRFPNSMVFDIAERPVDFFIEIGTDSDHTTIRGRWLQYSNGIARLRIPCQFTGVSGFLRPTPGISGFRLMVR